MKSIPIEFMTKQQWGQVIEGMCPVCKCEIMLIHHSFNEHMTLYQCGTCDRMFVDEED